MRFGPSLDYATADRPLSDQIHRYAPILKLAERFGFLSLWVGEAHPTVGDGRVTHLPSSLLLLAHLGHSTAMLVGTGVLRLPAYDPLRLAYDTAIADQLLNGRFYSALEWGGGNLLNALCRFSGDRLVTTTRYLGC